MRSDDFLKIFAKTLNFSELPDYLDQVEQRMIELVSGANPLIKEPMVRLIKGLDKRFAMFLVIPVARSQGKVIDDSVINSCAALELQSVAFCIHDDVLDNSNKRYGVPNINAVEGVNQAILIGDYIMNLAIQEALAVSRKIADVVIGAAATVDEGQIIELADGYNLKRTTDSYLNSTKLKTASHYSASCQVGALCAGLSNAQVQSFAKYGEAVGMTISILDDLLDFASTEQVMGKPVGKDVEEGVYTLPLLLGLKSPHKNRIKTLLKTIPKNEASSVELLNILISCGAIEKTIQEIRSYNDSAANALKDFQDNDVLSGLMRFPSQHSELAFEHFAVKLRGVDPPN